MDVRKLVTVVTGCPRDGRRRPHRWTDVDARLIIRIAFGQNSKPLPMKFLSIAIVQANA
jgi:hypothetical protein